MGNSVLTYAQMDAAADRIAAAFRALGAGKQTRVGILLANRVEYLDLWFGLSRIGAIQVPFNTAYRSAQILHVLRRAPMPIVVVEDALAANWSRFCPRRPASRRSSLSAIGMIIRRAGNRQVIDYETLVDRHRPPTPVEIEVSGADTSAPS